MTSSDGTPSLLRSRMTPSSPSSRPSDVNRAEYYRVGGLTPRPDRPEPYHSLQYKKRPSRVPWKSILLAIFLSVVGCTLLTLGSLMLTGHIDVKRFPPNRTWPMLVLGAIMFIPGIYHVRLAFLAWRGFEGYSFDDIPDYD